MRSINFYTLVLFLLPGLLCAQSYAPLGHHFITNYSPKTYKLNSQNFDIEQDQRGIMYFANVGGVLEFDGESWRTIKVPTQQTYALEKGKSNTIYVGALDDFGLLGPGEKGTVSYVSLSKQLKNEKVPTIRFILTSGEWVYFIPDIDITGDFLYAYNEQEKKVYKVVTPFKTTLAGMAGKRPVVQLANNSVYTLDGRNMVETGKAGDWKDFSIKAVFTLNDTVHVFNGKEIYTTDENFSKPVAHAKITVTPQSSNFLHYKGFFIYSIFAGINICDTRAKLLYTLNKQFNLIDNNVRALYVDATDNLWAATETGISCIDFSNTLSFYSYADGLDGSVEFIGKYRNNIIVQSKSGVFRLKSQISQGESAAFDKFTQITNAPYGLTNFIQGNDTTLYVADFEGILKYTGGNNFERVFNCAPWNVHQYKKYPEILLVPDYTAGILFLVNKGGRFEAVTIAELDKKSGRQVFEDRNGVLWLSDESNGIYRIEVNKSGNQYLFKTETLDEKKGLPTGFSFAFDFDNATHFGTEKGFYRYDGKRFVKSKMLKLDFAKAYSIHRANTDPLGNLWVVAYDVKNIKKYFFGYLTIKGNELMAHNQPFLKISEEKIDAVFHENAYVTWMGGPEGLFRYSKLNAPDLNRTYGLLLRQFRRGADTIYCGYGKFNAEEFSFPFAQEHYTFDFAATYYKTENGVKYKYFLEGLDKEWSTWTSNYSVEYSNLYEGNYTLHVKAVDDYGNESREFKLDFEITPPFYRTTVAYVLYGIGFMLIIIGAVRISSNGLKKIIAQRTKEIEEQKHILEEKQKEIIDSISYAERLQLAILPSKKSIIEALPNSFVMYRPKDIIAGDFFWMERFGNTVLFAVCDCTGHGVPGAMVSVVGANSLNRCVKEFNLRKPALILDKLTELVEETFSHSDNEVRDGMDVSLCSINFDTLEMEWAGANNPLWIFRHKQGGNGVPPAMDEYKADKQPIGKFENRKPFTNHTVKIEKGDIVYLFSDGYPDQFGGEKGKKFKYKNLQALLLKYAWMTMNEQRRLVEEAFDQWRGEIEQTDDVCLWVVKV
ncbi:MAG TPA: SpoIIE family protein phosphatase [Flavobacteriales bacterium]|nr:SpoIIE family protein phosphatase [Flavobacteriales bacterium]